jgi:DNA end-binding protein Ku
MSRLAPEKSADFDPSKYHDTYTEDVKKLIEDKAKGQKRQAPPPKPARSSNVIDLVAALQESLAQKKPRKRGAA